MTMPADPMEQLKSRNYVMLLALAAAIGVPVSVLAYFFLYFVSYLQKLIFVQLPVDVGFKGEPVWWPLVPGRYLMQEATSRPLTIRMGSGHHTGSPLKPTSTGSCTNMSFCR